MPRAQRPREDTAREDRIAFEIVVDAYNETERGWSWYYYLQEKIQFPFQARCAKSRTGNPLRPGDEVSVLEMAPQDQEIPEITVLVKIGRKKAVVRLEELECSNLTAKSEEAVADWHYWVQRGYGF